MKKIFKSIIVLASVIVTFASCQSKEEQITTPEGPFVYSFVVANGEATVDADTKVSIGDGNIEWDNANDEIGVFIGTQYEGYAKIDISSDPKKAILYSPTAISAGTKVYSYFPYDAENKDNDTYGSNYAKIVLNSIQTGTSNSSMPLAGIPFEVETEIAAKATEGNGEIKFLNLGSVINFKFFSADYAGETVEYVTFAAEGKNIAGDAVLDLTAVDVATPTSLDLTFVANETNTVKVTQSVGVAADKTGATPLKMVVAPETFSGVLTVVTDVATYTVNIPSRQYNRSGSRTFNVNLSGKPRVLGQPEIVKSLPYNETFASNAGEFTTDGVQANNTDVWTWGGASYGMKATSSFNSGNDKYDATSWLTSPWIDLTSVLAAYVSFDHVYRYCEGTKEDEFTLWVATYDAPSTWVQLTIPTWSSGNNWTFVNSEEILLNDYVGKKVKLGFKYIGSTTSAGTWEIKNLIVAEKVYTTEFTKDADAITVEVGKTKNNNVTVNSGATITYTSGDETVATVASDGTVTGVAEGTTTINYAVVANGAYPAANGSFGVTVTPASPDKVYFYESFDDCDGSGGNDNQFSGSIGSSAINADNTWTSTEKCGGAKECVKFGTSSDNGVLSTTISNVDASTVKLTFKAAGWGSGTNTLAVSSSTSGVSLSGNTNITLTNSTWKDYEVTISGIGNSKEFELTFTGKRGFIDEIAVFTGSTPTKPAKLADPEISYTTTSYSITLGDSFTAPTLNNPHSLTVEYSSDNTSVASVNSTTGAITLGSVAGTANITATFAGDATYKAGTASYTINVSAQVTGGTVVSIDFTSSSQKPTSFPSSGNNTTLATYTIAGYSFSFYATTSYKWMSDYLIIGKKNSYILLPAIEGKKLTQVKFTTTSGCSTNVVADIYDAAGENSVYGNTTAVGASANKTWDLTGTTANTSYQFRITSAHNIQLETLELTYSN